MKHLLSLSRIVLLIAVLIGAAVFFRFIRNVPESVSKPHPQCAHWCVFRCCQLLGAPIGFEDILKQLPFQEQGHSMKQMADILKTIGFETEGHRETLASLENQTFPCIAHLTDPDHFVVVSAVDAKDVHLFDGSGRRTARLRESFEKQWSGGILFVKKPAETKRLPAFLSQLRKNVPAIQFDSLLRDLGTVPTLGEPILFHYTFRNLGDADLVIEKVRPDCSCIEVQKPEKPIPPGAIGKIELAYHVQPQSGSFSHEVAVQTNDPQIPVIVLAASGWAGVELNIQPRQIDLGDMVDGYEKRFDCFVKYTGENRDLHVTVKNMSLRNATLARKEWKEIDKETAEKLFPGISIRAEKYDHAHLLELHFQPQGQIGERVEGTISLQTNIEGYERFTLEVSGTICPPIRVFPEVLNLADGKTQGVTVVSNLDEPFEAIQLKSGGDEIRWELAGQSKKEKTLQIHLDSVSMADDPYQIIEIEVYFPKSDKHYVFPFRVIP